MHEKRKTVALIGNPNCGKTTVFNLLTGTHQSVGNWPGVTVERKSGIAEIDAGAVTIVDLPGVYSLGGGGGLDEKIARDYVLSGDADVLVNIVDASNLERQFALTAELADCGVPMVLVLNMMDEAERHGRRIDSALLEETLGCPSVPLVATRTTGRDALARAISAAVSRSALPRTPSYAEAVTQGIARLAPLAAETGASISAAQARARALRLVESFGNGITGKGADGRRSIVESVRADIRAATGENAEDVIADARFQFAQILAKVAIKSAGTARRSWSDRIDRVVLNRFLGLPVFLFMMYLLFVVSFSGGNVFLDFIDRLSHAVFVDTPGWLLQTVHAPEWIVQLVAGAVGGAVELVLPFMAPVGFTFLFLTILEESGYMARGTFAMERFMRRIGLPGKTLVPMVVGFGCNVPAVMATRGIENQRDRLLVTMMQPFMSCSARLVIYMAFAAVFFRSYGGEVVFGLYVLGILMAVLTALLLGKTVLKGDPQVLVIDLPPYRFPTLKSLWLSVWQRLKIYIWRVGRVIATATVVIYLLSSFAVGAGGIRPTTDPGSSLLGRIGKAITPVFHPMGIEQDNWPATVGLFTGAVAKEVVIGTLNGAYAHEQDATSPDYRSVNIPAEIVDAFATIPANAAALVDNAADPLGFGNLAASGTAASYSGANQATLRALGRYFTPISAVAYLIFVLLYIPCVSTMGAIRRETGSWRWTIYAILWGLLAAYGLGSLWFQALTVPLHPLQSVLWIGGTVLVVLALVRGMRLVGRRSGGGRTHELAAPGDQAR